MTTILATLVSFAAAAIAIIHEHRAPTRNGNVISRVGWALLSLSAISAAFSIYNSLLTERATYGLEQQIHYLNGQLEKINAYSKTLENRLADLSADIRKSPAIISRRVVHISLDKYKFFHDLDVKTGATVTFANYKSLRALGCSSLRDIVSSVDKIKIIGGDGFLKMESDDTFKVHGNTPIVRLRISAFKPYKHWLAGDVYEACEFDISLEE